MARELATISDLYNDANLQGYWKLESDGTDSSSNGYDLSGTAPTYTTGRFGNGGDFEASSTQYITIADASCGNLEISGDQTWSCWVKPESLGNYQCPMSKNRSDGSQPHRILIDSTGRAYFGLNGLTGSTQVNSPASSVSTGNWYHIVGRYDSSATELSLWLNGVKYSATSSGSAVDTNGDFSIGRDGAYTAAGNYFDGVVDDCAIWDRALTDGEIRSLLYITLAKLTIQNGQVSDADSADLTNFPVLVTEDNIPSTVWASTDNGGGDVRFSSDSAGSTRLSCEVVSWDTSGQTCVVWVKVPTVDYNDDTDFYLWGDNTGDSQPAIDAAFGAEDVWSNGYNGVWHLNSLLDSTANDNDLTAVGSPTSGATGKVGTCYDFSGSGQYLKRATADCVGLDFNNVSFSVEAWVNGSIPSATSNIIVSKDQVGPGYAISAVDAATDYMLFVHRSSTGTSTEPNYNFVKDSWQYCAGVLDTAAGTEGAWVGSDEAQASYPAGRDVDPGAVSFNISGRQDGSFLWTGKIDEVRVSGVARTDGWIITCYNNQNSPADFIVGTEYPAPVGGGVTGFMTTNTKFWGI